MTGGEIMAVVGFFVMLSGVLWGAWWRVYGQIEKAKEEMAARAMVSTAKADMAITQVNELRLHVAENYVSKQGLRETKDEIMDAIHGVKQSVDHMMSRVDRIVESSPRTRTTRS